VPEPAYRVYRHERTRTRRWPYYVVAAVCVLAALAAWQVLAVPRVSAVTPGPDAYVKDPSLTVVLNVKGLPKLTGVRVTFDGDDITEKATRSGDKLTFTTGKLSDGPHSVSFTATSSNLFRHEVGKDWRFTVDTSIPTLELAGAADEGRINTSPATFGGTTEPYSTVTVSGGGVKASGQADSSGEYAVSADLPDGPSDVTITTADRAGNTTTKRLSVYVDADPPTLKTTQLGKTIGHSGLKIRIKARDQIGEAQLKLVLDGEAREYEGPPSRAVFTVKNLAQGKHTMVITASDKGGNVVTDKQTFVIDSTEHFGNAAMWPGARGKDVKDLQKRLAAAGVFDGPKNGIYDNHTVTGVKEFQALYGLPVDGLIGTMALNALSGQIIVDLGDLHLYLYRDGKLVRSYPVAAGQPAYPTPTGTYAVVNMQMDPTWLPPNSDWAKDAVPIPPGPDNPLGTRWIGTSAPGIGIHGTPDDSSIGSYASHGCIRMHIPDVEDLYARVVVGMPVIIRQ
jgi:peptidoglycan hydrolase-like protein with peptidoglycan-binding domain